MATYEITLTNDPAWDEEAHEGTRADAYAVIRELADELGSDATDEQIGNVVEVLTVATRGLTVGETALLQFGLALAMHAAETDPEATTAGGDIALDAPASVASA